MDAKCQLIAYRLDKQRRADLDGETATKSFQGPSPSKVPSVGLHSLRMEVHSCYIYIALPGGPTLFRSLRRPSHSARSTSLLAACFAIDSLAALDLACTSVHVSL
jgi:hypothetical protein